MASAERVEGVARLAAAAPRDDVAARAAEGKARSAAGRRQEVLRALRAAPLTVVALAERLAVHPNTVRFHLDRLLAAGQVERVPVRHGAPGRPALLFRALSRMDPAGPRHYRLLAEVLAGGLADTPDAAARAVAAGRAWGSRLEPPPTEAGRPEPGTGVLTEPQPGPAGTDQSIAEERGAGPDVMSEPRPGRPDALDRLVALLDSLGFGPELRDDGRFVGLRRCPFLELAERRVGVVCPVHLGIMQGALAAWGAGVTVDRLEPFVEPDLCLAHLAPVEARS